MDYFGSSLSSSFSAPINFHIGKRCEGEIEKRRLKLHFITENMYSTFTRLEQKVALFNAGQIGHSADVDVVHVLQTGAFLRRDHVHEGRSGFGPPKYESEALFAFAKDAFAGLSQSER